MQRAVRDRCHVRRPLITRQRAVHPRFVRMWGRHLADHEGAQRGHRDNRADNHSSRSYSRYAPSPAQTLVTEHDTERKVEAHTERRYPSQAIATSRGAHTHSHNAVRNQVATGLEGNPANSEKEACAPGSTDALPTVHLSATQEGSGPIQANAVTASTHTLPPEEAASHVTRHAKEDFVLRMYPRTLQVGTGHHMN